MTIWDTDTSFFYINLMTRTDRDTEFREEIKKMKIPIKQVKKVYGSKAKKGFIGCAMSHLRALQIGLSTNSRFICIFEDDFQLTSNIEEYIKKIDMFWDEFTDANVLMLQMNPLQLCETHNSNLFKVESALCAAGYMVKRSYIPSLIKNIMDSLKKKIPVDVGYTRIQSHGWYTFVPTMGKQRPSYSDIEKRFVNYGV